MVALLTEEDPTLSPIEKTLQSKVDKTNANSHYFNQFTGDLHGSDGLLYMDGKIVIPFTLKERGYEDTLLVISGTVWYEISHPAERWPQIKRQIYFHGINCSQCTRTGKKIKSIIPCAQINELPALSEPNESTRT